DTVGSVGAIAAALRIRIFGWVLADPLARVVVAALLLRSGYKVSGDSLHVVMGGTAKHVGSAQRIATVKQGDIKTVHDVHLWTIRSHLNVLTAHIVVDGNKKVYETDELLHALEKSLEHLGSQHITLQIESEQHYHDESILCEVEIEEPSLHH